MNPVTTKVWIEYVRNNIDALEASINIAGTSKYAVKNYLHEIGINASDEEIDRFTELIRLTIRYIRLSNIC